MKCMFLKHGIADARSAAAGALPQLVGCEWRGALPRLVPLREQSPGDSLAMRAAAHAARRASRSYPGTGTAGGSGLGLGAPGDLGVRISREEAARLRAGAGANSDVGYSSGAGAAPARAGAAQRGCTPAVAAVMALAVVEDRRALRMPMLLLYLDRLT